MRRPAFLAAPVAEVGGETQAWPNLRRRLRFGQAGRTGMEEDQYWTSCQVDEIYTNVGFQGGEADTCLLRTACTFVTVSIVSSWIGRRGDISRLLLFWWHWMR